MAATVDGTLKQWHRISLDFDGPLGSETASTFRDYRLDVTFTHQETGSRVTVPGFFAADGNAAETGASSGTVWRAHFNAPETGTYTYAASFRTGNDVAASTDPNAGTATAFNGDSGSFTVTASDKSGEDFRAKGMLKYVGEHYLQHAGSGEFFIKGGTDSPENFLAYAGFDNTVGTHSYSPHTGDWNAGDPTWQGGNGKGIIGAVNYLAEKGVNSIYFLPMNVGGDGKDVWPWTTSTARTTYDVSKLAQWEILFDHMDRNGIMLHVVTQETENDQLLNGGALGAERAIYYRELIARFGHHNGVVWNLGEENTNTDAQRKAFADYLKDVDPYDHPVAVHTYPSQHDSVYDPLLGHPTFDGPSLQTSSPRSEVLKWLDASEQAGHRWVANWDEVGPAGTGVMPDGASGAESNHQDVRAKLWSVLTAGGAGAEWYFGYRYPHNDLNLEDFRSRDSVWTWTDAATDFFAALPVTEMRMSDSLTPQTGDYVFAKPGEIYAIYLPNGGAADLDLSGLSGAFDVSWYDPRTGTDHKSSIHTVNGGSTIKLGTAPYDGGEDWAILVRSDPSGEGSGGGSGEVLPPVELWLIDSVTDSRVVKVSDGMVIDPAVLSGGQYAIEAAVDPALGVASVRFLFDGTTRVESVAPYALFGDVSGDFAGQALPDGPQAITVELFSGSKASGTKLADVSQSFEFSASAPDDGGTGTIGEATLSVTINGGIQTSNYNNNSFLTTNIGTKNIKSFEIDVTGAVYPDTVFDPFGLAGDTVAKQLTINTNGNTGVVMPSQSSYIGTGGIVGYEGIQLFFDSAVSGGFESGETLGFSIDMDPNSIAGARKSTLDAGSDPAWDVGGVSGAEIIGSRFTVTFEDDTTATGYLQGVQSSPNVPSQGGSQALASQNTASVAPTLTINGLTPGGVGTYGENGPQVLLSGPAGQTARVVLTKGFIQPKTNLFGEPYKTQLDQQLDALRASNFPANNAVEFQAIDIDLDGTLQDITSRFNFTEVPVSGVANADRLPLGFVAGLIDPNNGDLPISALTAPIYLTAVAVNALPVAQDDSVSTAADTAVAIAVLANDADADGDPLTVASVGAAANGGVVISADNTVTYTPDAGFTGADSFDYTVSDGNGGTDAASVTVTVGTAPAPAVVAAINAGGSAFTAADGTATSADTSFSGGKTFSTTAATAGTSDDALYQSERYGNFSYAVAVADGTYTVTLQFAEIYWNAAGKRVFDVTAEGNLILDDLDIFSAAGGKNIAYDVTIPVAVSDGTLNLDFITVKDNAKISAIQIAASDGGGSPTNALPVANTDSNWGKEDTGGASGNVLQSITHGGAPSGSFADGADTDADSDPLTLTQIASGTTSQPVSSSGTTAIAGAYGTLSIGADGAYSYAVDNTNNTVDALDDGQTLSDSFAYTVSDGNGGTASTNLGITVFGTTDTAGGAVVAAINAGGSAFTAADGTATSADTSFGGGKTYSNTAAIAGTTDDALYQSERWGNFGYAVTVDDGTYNVTLQFAEIYWNAAGKRVFDVTAEGNLILDDLDIFSAAGGKNIAYDVTIPVAVSDGTLNLNFTTVVNNAKLSGIKLEAASPRSPDDGDDGGSARSVVELSASDGILDATSAEQSWNDYVTISARDWSGTPAAIVYTDDGFGIAGGRFNSQIDHHPETDRSEQLVLDFGGAVSDVKLRFGRMNPDEAGGRETGSWSAYDAAGRMVDNGVLDPDAGDLIAQWTYDIPIDSSAPFSQLVIEATGYNNGSTVSGSDSSDFSVLGLTYSPADEALLIL